MVEVSLSDASQMVLRRLMACADPDGSHAVVLMPHARKEGYIAQFIPQSALSLLNTHLLGELLPGVPVYAFGVDLTRSERVELKLLLPNTIEDFLSEDPEKYYFQVNSQMLTFSDDGSDFSYAS